MTDTATSGLPSPVPSRARRIAMALYADVSHDSRVLREATTLAAAGHAVTVYCLAGRAPDGAPFEVRAWTPDRSSIQPDGRSPFLRARPASLPRRIARQAQWVVGYGRNLRAWGGWAVAAAGDVDVWHAHDLTGLLAVAPRLPAATRLVYDSHEIFLETGTAARLPGPLRRVLRSLEGRFTRRAVALVTVNEAYAEVLERYRPRRTILVRNCPPRWSPGAARSTQLRAAAGIPADADLVLYHGIFARHRGIEQLVEAMSAPGLGTAHLAILGFGETRAALEALAADPRFGGRIHVVDGVAPDQLIDWVSGADVDVIALQRSTLNHWLCTPNKLWESLAAGVPVVVSDFPVMARIVLEDPAGPLGGVCQPADPASIGAAVREILAASPERRAELRDRCLRVAHERWNWERESERLVELYATI